MVKINRLNSLKKGVSKVKNVSSKIKENSMSNKLKKNKSKNSKLGIEYIVPESSPLRKNAILDSELEFDDSESDNNSVDYIESGYKKESTYSDNEDFNFNHYYDDLDSNSHLNNNFSDYDLDHGSRDNSNYDSDFNLDGVDRKYTKYIFGEDHFENYSKNEEDLFQENPEDLKKRADNKETSYVEDYLKSLKDYEDLENFHGNGDFTDENFNSVDFKEMDFKEENSRDLNFKNIGFKEVNSKNMGINNLDFENDYFYDDLGSNNYIRNDLDNNGFKNANDSKNNSLDIKSKINNFKKNLLKKDNRSKANFGKIVIFLIILVLILSIFYFFVYQPFQDELSLERNSKLNELNTLYKGPLAVHENAYTLKNQIESEYDINELKSIDILRYATKDWRTYHSSKIVSSKDDFGRVMLAYGEENKNIIMSVQDANNFVKDNDAKVLSNIQFEKVDTTIVPVSISRLQATAGLITVGSIVDIYSLNDNYSSYNYEDSDNQVNSDSSINSTNSNEDLGENGESNEEYNGEYGGDNTDAENSEPGDDSMVNPTSINDYGNDDSELGESSEPDVSGATVLAILRSKDSGVIDSSISNSNTLIEGNTTTPYENTSSYSNDVEELLKASVFNSYDNNNALESYLNNYGIKLSNYERMSNLGDLDSEYLVLLEVPREDVSFVINNMDNLILTIPTEYAPIWVVNELQNTYYENINNYNSNSLLG